MDPHPPSAPPQDVLVAGGGVAGLETILALRDLAGDRVRVTLLAPDSDFVARPLSVREPFAYGAADRFDLASLAEDLGVELVAERLSWVDTCARAAHTTTGRTLTYDALMVAVGARPFARHPLALTLAPERMDAQLHGIVQDIEGGYVHRLAFVIPSGMTWPLPIYELALMTAQRAYDAQAHVEITIVTPEPAPLAIFGEGASDGLRELLDEAGIRVVRATSVQMPAPGRLVVAPGDARIEADRVLALPELRGPTVRGLPTGAHGLIPIDPYCRVRRLQDVYAAGDATDHPVKHGGVSAQQAVTAATSIAARAGAPVMPRTLRPTVDAVLFTGGRPRYLSARVAGDYGRASQITDTPPWSPPGKIVASYLAPYLATRERVDAGSAAGAAR